MRLSDNAVSGHVFDEKRRERSTPLPPYCQQMGLEGRSASSSSVIVPIESFRAPRGKYPLDNGRDAICDAPPLLTNCGRVQFQNEIDKD